MVYVRRKTIKGRTYYYLVKSRREGGKVRQVVLEYLGAKHPTETKLKEIIKKHEKN